MLDYKGCLEINNTKLFFTVKGEGNPLILVHGGFTDHRIWDYQIDAFADKYKIICFDQRGYGKSDFPMGPFSHSQDLKAIIDALELTKATIIGSSLGGAVAIEFALQYPEHVNALIVVGTALKGYPYPPHYMTQIMELSAKVTTEGIGAGIDHIITSPGWDYFFPSPARPEARAKVEQAVRESTGVFRWNPMWDVELKPSAYERIGEIKSPVLIVSNSRDIDFVHGIEDYIQGKLTNSEKIVMEDCCHLPYVEKPEEFNQIILNFLQGVVK